MSNTCASCKWFYEYKGVDLLNALDRHGLETHQGAIVGQCRKNTPTIGAYPYVDQWPAVQAKSWCGGYQQQDVNS